MMAIFKYIGIFVVVAILGVGIWIGLQLYQGMELDKTSREYVSTNLPKLAKERWYGPYMRPLAHTAFMQAVSMEQWQKLSEYYYRNLGDLKKFGECDGQARIDYNNGEKQVSANYACPADFAKGEALIEVRLVQENEQWKVIGINVKSEQFLN